MVVKMSFDTELKNYYLVKFEDDGKLIEDIEIIWGTIKVDNNRGLREDDYICTTNIAKRYQVGGNDYIKTANTVYKVHDLIDTIILPMSKDTITNLRSGVSPVQVLALEGLEYTIEPGH